MQKPKRPKQPRKYSTYITVIEQLDSKKSLNEIFEDAKRIYRMYIDKDLTLKQFEEFLYFENGFDSIRVEFIFRIQKSNKTIEKEMNRYSRLKKSYDEKMISYRIEFDKYLNYLCSKKS